MTEQLWGYEHSNTTDNWIWLKKSRQALYRVLEPNSTVGFSDTWNSVPIKNPSSLTKVWPKLHSISWPIRDGESVPAAFAWWKIVLSQSIDHKLYTWILRVAKLKTTQAIQYYENKTRKKLSQDERCQIAMHMISNEIAIQLREWQNDKEFKNFAEENIEDGKQTLSARELKERKLENCIMKSVIAKKFLELMWFKAILYSCQEEEHDYITVDTWKTTRRFDANSPISTKVEWYGIFHAANMTSQGNTWIINNEAIVRWIDSSRKSSLLAA